VLTKDPIYVGVTTPRTSSDAAARKRDSAAVRSAKAAAVINAPHGRHLVADQQQLHHARELRRRPAGAPATRELGQRHRERMAIIAADVDAIGGRRIFFVPVDAQRLMLATTERAEPGMGVGGEANGAGPVSLERDAAEGTYGAYRAHGGYGSTQPLRVRVLGHIPRRTQIAPY